jgi:hypothetical protein
VKPTSDLSRVSHARRDILKAAACTLALGPLVAHAEPVEVALAGLAFSGDAASMAQRFPYSVGYEKALKAGGRPAYAMLREAIAQSPPQQLKLVTQIDELKGRDQAIAVALVIGSETVSVEHLAGLHKLFVLIRAQALFFDFKSMSVVRAYPISFGHIDVFDRSYASQTWSGAFHDPKLPKGYAPFGIQNLNGMLFVTYAKTQKGSNDEKAGQGRGAVDAFATDGTFLGRVATHGRLNAPWGLAWAPADFGRFSNDLIVGNFGDGKLHAYRWDGKHWHPDGELKGANHKPLDIDGLWAIEFGGGVNTANDGAANTLFYTAGPDDEAAGAFGTITATTP